MHKARALYTQTRTVLLLFIFIFSSGCSLKAMKEQSEGIESAGTLTGKVESQLDVEGRIYVKLYRKDKEALALYGHVPVNSDGTFRFRMLPGTFLLAAYIDVNNDQTYSTDEPATFLSDDNKQPSLMEISAGQKLEAPLLSIAGESEFFSTEPVKDSVYIINKNIGRVIDLDDEMFKRENASTGLWRPFDFLQHVGGGLMLLQEYDANKIPVVFVHGIGGTPLEFKDFIDQMDQEKFQPWVLYYPSGFRLDMVSEYFHRAMNQLHAKYQFEQVYLVTHSMGGLMSRSYLMKHQQYKDEFAIGRYVTINSPLYGMDSAISGVEYSPIVVPVWRDVASNSEYVRHVHEWHVPEEIDYHLFFSFLPGEEGDGIVPLTSQLSISLQEEADKIYGFKAQHAGILVQQDFIQYLNKVLD